MLSHAFEKKNFISFHICFITNFFFLPLPIKTIKPNLNIQIYTFSALAQEVRGQVPAQTYIPINRQSKIIYWCKYFRLIATLFFSLFRFLFFIIYKTLRFIFCRLDYEWGLKKKNFYSWKIYLVQSKEKKKFFRGKLSKQIYQTWHFVVSHTIKILSTTAALNG